MRIGILTGIWYVAEQLPVLESLERAAALGFRFVDLHGVFHAGPRHLTPEVRREVKTRMASLGLTPRNYVLHAPHNLASATEAELEASYRYLCEGIDLAVGWKINQLMLNAGIWGFGVDRAEGWTRAVRFMQRLCEYASPRDLFIAQETEPYVWFLVNDLASSLRMMADVDRPNFVNLIDLGHMALAREGAGDLEPLKDAVVHVHMSDHEAMRHTNQVVGTGLTPAADYLEMLREMGLERNLARFGYEELVVSFELGFPGDVIDDPDEWVRRSLNHVRAAAPFLQL